jgi:hypothetical protein
MASKTCEASGNALVVVASAAASATARAAVSACQPRCGNRDEASTKLCRWSGWPDRRLLLSNYDVGISVPAHALQLGLNFAASLPELFVGKEMGKDALRVLNDIIPLQAAIRADVAAELPHLRETAKWAARLV